MSFLSTLRLAPACLLVLWPILSGCGNPTEKNAASPEMQQATEEIQILINENRQILVDGEIVAPGELEAKLEEKTEGKVVTIVVNAAPNVSMGMVHDVLQKIPSANVAEIRFPLPVEMR